VLVRSVKAGDLERGIEALKAPTDAPLGSRLPFTRRLQALLAATAVQQGTLAGIDAPPAPPVCGGTAARIANVDAGPRVRTQLAVMQPAVETMPQNDALWMR
jgi:hypothetical protein